MAWIRLVSDFLSHSISASGENADSVASLIVWDYDVFVYIQDVQTAIVDLEEVRAYRNDIRSRCAQVNPFCCCIRTF